MATILIIEDRPLDRKLLATILRTASNEVVEASDGQEALDILPGIKPDVVISDILMPTVDGYEFVRRMREIPGLAPTPVIFYTATYHEREARALALQCGVVSILTKPSPPHVILSTVEAALGSSPGMLNVPLDREEFDRDHLHLVNSTLAARIDRFEAEKERLKAVLEVTEGVAAERDPLELLNRLCTEARNVTLAQHAVVGLLNEKGSPRETLYTSGFDAATSDAMKPPSIGDALLSAVVGKRRTVRTRNPDGHPDALGLPAEHPPVSSLLSVPVASSSRVYGWLSLRNKLGTDEFTDVDECVAVALGAHAGVAYENARLCDGLRRRVAALEQERERTSARVREEERIQLSRTLHDEMGQVLTSLNMDLHWLSTRLPTASGASPNDIANKVGSMQKHLDQAIESVHVVASELRSAVLDKLGLIAAIEWQTEEFERRSGIRCRLDSRVDQVSLDPFMETMAFAIIQEALTNVLRHAQATRVTVTVRKSLKFLTVSVIDNGRGISERDLASGSSLGLIGMRERSALIGGTFEVRRRPSPGTIVTFSVPLAVRSQ